MRQEIRDHVRSSRDGLPVQREPAPPFHDLYKRNVDRTHRRKRLHRCTRCTDAMGTPTFLMGRRKEGKEPQLVPILIIHGKPKFPPSTEYNSKFQPNTGMAGCTIKYGCEILSKVLTYGNHKEEANPCWLTVSQICRETDFN